ncbi:hypothetical protein NEMBOFW57_006535 [Staphylotrichum longicolle]|uniref:Heterokaryon incompatibility domain-containing protein n=1 Tax=Staphylotrichum longicolle TaxID=669026 RepID=A0AAD4ETF8_9PEZI|nr:hypothetical protein NEMBOFW57_006535 [Staphylotrichum longicolle]
MCSKDIIRRPYSSRECCDTCKDMTGTADGLRGLLDPCGYKHLNCNDCGYDEDEVIVPGEIRITGSFTQLANIKGGDILEGKLIKNIWVHLPEDWPYGRPDDQQREAWNVVTFDDDEDDKMEQIALMGLIYKHSTLTIVAASAQKVTDGFLRDGNPNQPAIQLPFYVDHATTGTVYLRWRDPCQTPTSAYSEPIFQRGWTYQEQLLSPRALVFDSNQIMFKCLTDDYRPVFETYLKVRADAPKLPIGVFPTMGKNLERGDASRIREDYNMATQDETWRAIVCDYSRRELSRFSDRLPALAGIAAELAAVWDDIYLAGFWGGTILHHLGWYRPRNMFSRFIEKTFEDNPFEGMVDCKRRAAGPTWSWATAPFPVRINEVRNPDPKLVRFASITLEAKVLNAAATLREFTAEAEEYPLGSVLRELPTWPPTYEFQDLIEFDFEEPNPDVELCSLVRSQAGIDG